MSLTTDSARLIVGVAPDQLSRSPSQRWQEASDQAAQGSAIPWAAFFGSTLHCSHFTPDSKVLQNVGQGDIVLRVVDICE
jgi:hypothetical protein